MAMHSWEQQVVTRIDELKNELITLCQDLVRIPSWDRETGGEAEVAHRLGKTLEQHKIEPELYRSHPHVENLIASWTPKKTERRLLFNGHIDVVPPGDDWSVNPFDAEIKDNKIYGRGTVDMKGGVASMTMALCALRDLDVPLKGTAIINAVGDEERQGELGTTWCINNMWNKIKADAAIICEPSGVGQFIQTIFIGEKGPVWIKVRVKGVKAHGSLPLLGKNAITRMMQILSIAVERGPPTITPPLTREEIIQGLAEGMGIKIKELESFIETGGTQNPIHASIEALTKASLNIGKISGGVAPNVVADRCEAELDFRILPGQKPEEMTNYIKALSKELGFADDISVEIVESFEGTSIPDFRQNPIVSTLFSVSKEIIGPTAYFMAPFATDARLLRRAGLTASVVFGPGDALMAHKADENISIEHLVNGTKAFAITTIRYLGVAN